MNKNFDWKNRRVLVTGASGIVGSWLIKELLALDVYIVALVRDADPQTELFRSGDIRRVSVVSGRLEDFTALERAINKHEIDTIFHLGAQAIVGTAQRYPLATFEANIRGTYQLLEACRQHKDLVRRVVIASSDKAYGEQPQLPYVESMPLQGKYPYEVSKSCTDLIAQSYFHSYGLPVGIARCGNVYGGGDINWSRIVPGTVRSLLRGERPQIRSDGAFVRDYIYVKDVARAYIHLAQGLEDPAVHGEAFNFSDEAPMTVLALVDEIRALMQAEHLEPAILNSASGEIKSQYLSAEKARKTLAWEPAYSRQAGLSETIAWYRQFFAEQPHD